MPFKHNAARRHHIGKMKFKVTNWREYEAGLRRRGSLTLWITPEALSSWQAPRGGHFSAMEQPELLAQDIWACFRPLRR